jgi:nitroreductase
LSLDIQNAIKNRRIIKKFKPDPIDLDILKSWLQVATFAPNHRMTEPWEVLFLGTEARAKINHKTNFGNAPVAVAILSKHGSSEVEKNENMVAVSCFIQNFMLLAWSNGIGTSWSSLGVSQTVRNTLNVSDDYSVIGIFGVGYPEEIPVVKKRTSIDNKIKHLE